MDPMHHGVDIHDEPPEKPEHGVARAGTYIIEGIAGSIFMFLPGLMNPAGENGLGILGQFGAGITTAFSLVAAHLTARQFLRTAQTCGSALLGTIDKKGDHARWEDVGQESGSLALHALVTAGGAAAAMFLGAPAIMVGIALGAGALFGVISCAFDPLKPLRFQTAAPQTAQPH